MNNTEFIKKDNTIIPKIIGSDYNLEPGKIYTLTSEGFPGQLFLKLSDISLAIPKKIFSLKKDEIFKNRILTYFNNTDKKTVGVMLAGIKGTGKTLFAKTIALESGLPIIIVDGNVPAGKLSNYFDKIKQTPMCLLFDEVEKKWDTEDMLTFLDGLSDNSKKLILLTCNKLNKVSEYMQDRCSRIRYLRKYSDTENIELIDQILEYNNIKGNDAIDLAFYIKNYIKLLSVDNICSFIEEYVLFKDKYDLNSLLEFMNLTKIDRNLTKETVNNNKIVTTETENKEKNNLNLNEDLTVIEKQYNLKSSDLIEAVKNYVFEKSFEKENKLDQLF